MLQYVAVFSLALLLNGSAYAQNVAQMADAAKAVAEFSKAICPEVPLSGHSVEKGIDGKANAEFLKMLKKLADIGFSVGGEYKESEYSNFLQKDLVEMSKSRTECNLIVWNDIKQNVLNPPLSSRAKVDYKDFMVFSIHEFNIGKGGTVYADITIENISNDTVELLAIRGLTSIRMSRVDQTYKVSMEGIEACTSTRTPAIICARDIGEKSLTIIRPNQPFIFRISMPFPVKTKTDKGHINISLLIRKENTEDEPKKMDISFIDVPVE